MKYSIICSVYNGEQYVGKAINSVINQSFKEWELILVDDGSTDSTRDICDFFSKQDDRIVAIHKENEGPLLSRARGVSLSKGDYLLFMDADDYYDVNALYILNGYLEETNIDILIFNYYRVERRDIFPFNFAYLEDCSNINDYRGYLLKNCLNSLWIKCIKRTLYKEDIVFYQRFNSKVEEDLLYSLEPFDNAKTIGFLKKNLYYYNNNFESTSHIKPTINNVLVLYNELALEKLLFYQKKWGMPDDIRHSILEHKCKQIYDLAARYWKYNSVFTIKSFIRTFSGLKPICDFDKRDIKKMHLYKKEDILLIAIIKHNFLVIIIFALWKYIFRNKQLIIP